MAFKIYLDGFLLPVAPPKIDMKINNQNKTFTLANMQEINVLKSPGLTDIMFTVPVPLKNYPWVTRSVSPQEVIGKLEALKTSCKQFQFIVSREFDNGSTSFSTNLTVGLEDYRLLEDAEDASDLSIEINLKQFATVTTKVVYVLNKDEGTTSNKPSKPSSPNKPSNNKPRTYTVKHGDSMWEIAKKCLGDGSKYKQLYSMNKELIDKRNAKEGTSKYTIYTGQVLRLG